ncbi:uncharacterized protein LOC129754071 [Uranotaenia lowii]|uniref:uncharacterized protein LOC129754071 n=1 Tax=Uranotaenia lowii TaxID=190385 RepID=UPI0024799858|nr:uncharacterized protein LOC129754071 [Uranotaenia lowii]
MGIADMGSRKIILEAIKETKIKKSEEPSTSKTAEKESIRELLSKHSKMKFLINNYLDVGKLPEKSKIHELIRFLCEPYEKRIYDGKGYPSMTEQWILAKAVVKEFPILKTLRTLDSQPDEFPLFAWRGGQETGDHSGLIYSRVRNIIKKLPTELKKYSRRKIIDPESMVTESMIQIADDLVEVFPNSSNKLFINMGMKKCEFLHASMLKYNRTPEEILEKFPHFKSYDGEMITLMYYMMKPTACRTINFLEICLKGTMLNNMTFREVEDVNLRGFLRLYKRLRGPAKKNTEGEYSNVEELSVAEMIKWKTDVEEYLLSSSTQDPQIICNAPVFKAGDYYLIIGKQVVVKTASFVKIIDLFFKSLLVFGALERSNLKMINDVVSISIYKTLKTSRRKCVNEVCSMLKEAENVEDEDEST